MAKFLETLAETGIVLEACDEACKSSTAAYALRRRNPAFAHAWETALGIARDRLADTLLGRSLEGNVEQIIKDGVIVAEKHFLDNRLGLAILKRLDQRTDGAKAARQPLPSPIAKEPDWEVALHALRTGEADDIGMALAMLKGGEVGEVANPPLPSGPCKLCAAPAEEEEPKYGCWREEEEWWTDFPPPENFDGYEQGQWGSYDYKRHCTDEELVLLEAEARLEVRDSLAEAAEERDRWFAELKEDVEADGGADLIEEIKSALVNGTSVD
jgi:hypothetical protein